MIVVGGWPGRNVVGLNGRFGVRPADFASGGDFDNPLANDVDAGDETTEFVAVVTSLPASGAVVFDDLGGFEHTGAADGSYSTVFQLYTWAQGGPLTDEGSETITTQFGATGAEAPGVTLTAGAGLLPGSATAGAAAPGALLLAGAGLVPGGANAGAAAAGVLLVASASLQPGGASAEGSASAPGALLQLAASLIAGNASGQFGGQAQGALFDLVAAFLRGSAYGPNLTATPGFIAKVARRNFAATIEPAIRTASRRLQ